MKTLQLLRRQFRTRRPVAAKPARADDHRAALSEALGYPVQAKLKVGAPDDVQEREADAAAERALAVPEGVLQRKCAACQQEDDEEERKKATGGPDLRRKEATAAGAAGGEAPAGIGQVLGQPGRPLEPSVRRDMEQRFGHDFSQVRLHRGSAAERSAEAVNARAYTVGQDIVFGAGEYAPTSNEGRKLLAHELAHTVQQSDGGASLRRRLGDGHDLRAARFAGDPVLEACFDDERYLQSGSQGPAVSKLQQALVDAGFPLPSHGVDGIFMSETQTALKNYQRSRGLDPDGVVGPLTMGALDSQFAGGTTPPGTTPPGTTPPGTTPPGTTPPGTTPPGTTPPGTTPPTAPPATIASQTVETAPGARTRTTVGVGEQVNLTHSAGSATWSTTAGTLSAVNGISVTFTAPDVAGGVTIRANAASLTFTVMAPIALTMDREPGTGVKHTQNRADSGIQTRPHLLPDVVNFHNVEYREMDVAGTATSPGPYSCNPASGGHCSAGGGGAACRTLSMTDTVVSGLGTRAVLGDCAYSGHCGTAPPFAAASLLLNIPHEYRVGSGPFRPFYTVVQLHTVAADGTTLTTFKAGATGQVQVADPTVTIAACP
jgi:hypothetical protein